eukprot:NODE_2737_length_748_cov_148.005722_g1922_i0.p4 GENE.NODE_2737_length_748_cov_148.005722_g1922_i0~~NODE_2737_length_748_cov_148.005722_g1922_i0.p4  ORF type:complete len:204 (-),score=99.92 NODE_2737_length_748_cov_148.005722_g1922_i0:109-720(-)
MGGKPPVDEAGTPLYGDVFGVDKKTDEQSEPVDQRLWGEMEEDDSDDEDSDAEGDADDVDEEGFASTAPPASEGATETTESATGTDTGTETPDVVQLKKFSGREEDRKLFQTLETQKASVGANIMGSSYTYAMPRSQAEMEVSLNPGEVDQYQNPHLAQEKYSRAVEEVQQRLRGERDGADDEEIRKRGPKGHKDKPHKSFKF